MKYETKLEAARAWVNEFNAIPCGIIEKLLRDGNYDELNEITPPACGDRVNIYRGEHAGEYGEIVRKDSKCEDAYIVALDGSDGGDGNGEEVSIPEDEFEVIRDDFLPMYGTMWAFKESIDNYWLSGELDDESGKSALQAMADCGFRIYEQEDYGYIFGIDGCGYDFYESHWIPLYDARGLHWHKDEMEAA